jgi:hypothetical protein
MIGGSEVKPFQGHFRKEDTEFAVVREQITQIAFDWAIYLIPDGAMNTLHEDGELFEEIAHFFQVRSE